MDGKQSKVYERLNISLLCNLCVKYAVVVTAIGILPRRWCWPFPSPPLICPTFLPSALIISGILFKNISNIQSAQRTHCVQCLHYVSQALWLCPLQNSPPPLYNDISHVPPLHIQRSHTPSIQYTSPVLFSLPSVPDIRDFPVLEEATGLPAGSCRRCKICVVSFFS